MPTNTPSDALSVKEGFAVALEKEKRRLMDACGEMSGEYPLVFEPTDFSKLVFALSNDAAEVNEGNPTSIYYKMRMRIHTDDKALIAAIKNTNTRFLMFSGNNLTDLGAKNVCKGLMEGGEAEGSGIVNILGMNNNNIRVEGFGYVAQFLATERAQMIYGLVLSNNEGRCLGTTKVVKQLRHNTTLRHLNLENNKISNNGAKAIGAMLGENAALTSLDLSHNRIGESGAHAIATGLRKNTVLDSLYLQDNEIRDTWVEVAKAILEREDDVGPSGLKVLNAAKNKMSGYSWDELTKLQKALETTSPIEIYGISDQAINVDMKNVATDGYSTLTQELSLTSCVFKKAGDMSASHGFTPVSPETHADLYTSEVGKKIKGTQIEAFAAVFDYHQIRTLNKAKGLMDRKLKNMSVSVGRQRELIRQTFDERRGVRKLTSKRDFPYGLVKF